MKSAFMVQRPEKLFIHSDTGPPTGRWKDDDGEMILSRSGQLDTRRGVYFSLTPNLYFQTLAATFADPWIRRGITGIFNTNNHGNNKIE